MDSGYLLLIGFSKVSLYVGLVLVYADENQNLVPYNLSYSSYAYRSVIPPI